MISRSLVIALALIGLAFWCWRVFFPGPERIIRSRLSTLAKTASFEPKEGVVVRGYKLLSITDFLTKDAVIKLEMRGMETMTYTGQEEISTAAKQLALLNGLNVEFLDINVALGADKQTAIVDLTGKATVAGEKDFYVQ